MAFCTEGRVMRNVPRIGAALVYGGDGYIAELVSWNLEPAARAITAKTGSDTGRAI
ncbi:hypothetical protein [Paracoccus mutanolyticus]|uniref:hypothetical protein n=1 Tax=Paracoccus mutanolyticus TaxID=1499308 RepID=UPI00167BDEEE|nr:hypothetical protein [Paracoccus mutanolyticus]